jgi:hypothetical protein
MNVRLSLLLALAGGSLAASQAHAGTPPAMAMGMGPMRHLSVPAFQGYYDGHKDTFLSTDISSADEAKAEHVNYSRKLGASAKTSEEIYLVTGRTAPGQLAVFSAEPGEPTYTPLWHEEFVTWKQSVRPQLLVRDDQITKLEKQGMLSVRETSVVLNCPIVKVGA